MMTARVRRLLLALGALLAPIGGAHSANLALTPPVVFSGWHLHGDIGFSNQRVGSLFNANYAHFDSVNNIDKGFDAAPFFGLGIGYTFNNWLRLAVTGEYRGAANFLGLGIGSIPAASCSGAPPCFADDRYTAGKSEWTILFNGYVDLGDARSGDVVAFDGTNNANNPMGFRHLTSHDVKLGGRFNFGGYDSFAGPPPPSPSLRKRG
ncbi:MAG TPA: hypothetical protein VFP60_00560 [Pseudolabrys sp.]|nr:hypothetical protein [Pseudolabrys sp.]